MKSLLILVSALFFTTSAQATNTYTLSQRASQTWLKLEVKPITQQLADVLFIIDDSGSMTTYQQKLTQSAPLIAKTLADKQGLTHVAFLTTTTISGYSSYPTNGQFITGILESTSPTFEKDLAKGFSPGTNGDATEKPFLALMNGLSPQALSTFNSGFLRPEADLHVVIVTDTYDQSSLLSPDVAQFLKNLKGNRNAFVHALSIPASANATCQGQTPSAPDNISEIVSLTGGSLTVICDTDLVTPLSNAINVSLVYEDRIALPSPEKMEIDFSTLTVKVGTTTLVLGDIQNGWTFDSLKKEVILSQGALKQASILGHVSVTYKVF